MFSNPLLKQVYLVSTLIVASLFVVMAADAAERMAVQADIANVRSEPDENSTVLWQVEKYYPLSIIRKKGDWYKFKDFEGDQGWIHASLLDKTQTVIVRVRQCNVRTGPGTEYDIAFPANKGTPFKVLQIKGRWCEVQYKDGDRGWIFKQLLW